MWNATEADRIAGPQAQATKAAEGLEVRDVCLTVVDGRGCIAWRMEGVSFAVQRGQVLAVVGANGSGKTTLLNLLAGVWYPDSGQVLWEGLAPHSVEFRRGLGLVLAEDGHWAEADRVGSWLQLHARLHGLDRQTAAERVNRVLVETELVGLRNQQVISLSRGFRKRLLLAQAVIGDPRYLLLDEPYTSLDPDWTEWLHHRVERLSSSGAIVVIVAHQLDELDRIATNAVFLASGRVTGNAELRPWESSDQHRASRDWEPHGAGPGWRPQHPGSRSLWPRNEDVGCGTGMPEAGGLRSTEVGQPNRQQRTLRDLYRRFLKKPGED